MTLNKEAIMANMGTFSHAYGLKPKSDMLLNALHNIDDKVTLAGLLLRNNVTKKILLTCQFPVDGYYTNDMIWVAINDVNVEAVPVFSAGLTEEQEASNWKKQDDMQNNEEYEEIYCGKFKLIVHQMFRKNGIIDKFNKHKGFGFIKRNHRGIFFKKNWCINKVEQYQEVSFFPIISKKGLQARKIKRSVDYD